MARAIDCGEYFRIPCDARDLNYDKIEGGNPEIEKMEECHSHNTRRLNVEEMKAPLQKLTFIREDFGLQPRSKSKEIRSEVSTHCMALALFLFVCYLCFELKNRETMNMSEFYSDFLFRYRTDAVPRKISINAYCISEGIGYRNFIKWYRDNKKRLRESEMEEIHLSPLTVTGIPKSDFSSSGVFSSKPSVEESNVVSFHLKLSHGIEINKENANLDSVTRLLQSLSALC